MTSYPRWRIVNIEATSLLNRTSTSTYKQPQSTSIIEIITLKWIHFYAVYRTCELFYSSCLSSSSIVSCIQFQHCIAYTFPASYRVSSSSIALLCIQFQHRIVYPDIILHYCASSSSSVSRSSYRIISTFPVHGLTSWCGLPGRGVNNLPVWITFLGWTTWPNHQRLTWVDFLHGWPNVHVSQCEWITLTLPDGITLVT